MKIEIKVDSGIEENCISISCSRLTPELERIIAMLRIMEKKFAVSAEGETFLLDVATILYIEAVDRKTLSIRKKGCTSRICDCMNWKSSWKNTASFGQDGRA